MPLTIALPLLIATDLDGTLLRRDGSISTRSRAVLRQARAAGVQLVMVTGRPARHVAKIEGARELGGLAICVNGALIYDLDRELVLDRSSLERARRLRARPGFTQAFAGHLLCRRGWPRFRLGAKLRAATQTHRTSIPARRGRAHALRARGEQADRATHRICSGGTGGSLSARTGQPGRG